MGSVEGDGLVVLGAKNLTLGANIRDMQLFGTGRGDVFVNEGRLGGIGSMTGTVTVGSDTGSAAFLSPGSNTALIGTMTIRHDLIFQADGSYEFALNSDNSTADQVVAN